jgi:hypothetical protein
MKSPGADLRKSVILLGYRHTVESPRTRYPEAELWGQSNSIPNWDYQLFDWSRWFDVHTLRPQGDYAGIQLLRPHVLDWYQKQGPERPIYFAEHIPSVRASTVYPLAAIEAQFGRGRFGCQVDYMIALALQEGFERIVFYGCGEPYVKDPTSDQAKHWLFHHHTVWYWMGRAEAMGVEFVYDGPCMNAPKPTRYGYEMGPQ